MSRTMSMYQDFSNQFNNLTLKDILSSNKKQINLQENKYTNLKSNKSRDTYAKINNILKQINDNKSSNESDSYASIFLNKLKNSNVINTKRYIWHIADPTMRYSIIKVGLLTNKSKFRAVFANNDIWLPMFYPIYFEYMCYEKCWRSNDFWRIDTFKLNSIWLADANRCHDANGFVQ